MSGAHGIGADASRRDGSYIGAGYLFALEGQVWRQSTYFKASNAESADSFGMSVGLSDHAAAFGAVWEDSGSRGVNGAEDNESAQRSGAVYVFE